MKTEGGLIPGLREAAFILPLPLPLRVLEKQEPGVWTQKLEAMGILPAVGTHPGVTPGGGWVRYWDRAYIKGRPWIGCSPRH